jgi:hypothetical protein
MMDSNEAAAALAGVSGAQARLADQVGTRSPGRHAAFGLVMTLLVGGLALPLPLQTATMVVAMALVVLILRYDRRRYGVFINGYRRGRTLPLTLLLLVGMLALMLGEIYARGQGLGDGVKIALAGAAFLFATAGSVAWKRIFLEELNGAPR